LYRMGLSGLGRNEEAFSGWIAQKWESATHLGECAFGEHASPQKVKTTADIDFYTS
jgi:hypothetical protein